MATDASSLRCPNCGAAADPEARRCPYCRARLATISCPSCFGLMFRGATFCARCGARRARDVASPAGDACPACTQELHRVDIGDTAVLECESCDGIWVDAEAFERLCADHAARAAVLHRISAEPAVDAARPVRYRPCLRCGKMMNRVNFGRISGTVVDVCRGHGTFLDPGELHRIVTFIQGGGLDRMRKRELEDLRSERARLGVARQVARSGPALSAGQMSIGVDTRALRRLMRRLLGRE